MKTTIIGASASRQYGRYDIPTGWFHWAMFFTTVHDGRYMDAYEIFHKMEAEIDQAHRDGRLPVRSVLPLPDPRVGVVVAALPSGLWHTLKQLVHEPPPEAFVWHVESYRNPEFTSVLHRRAVLPSPERDAVWAVLVKVYSWLYVVLLPVFFAIMLAASVLVFRNWKIIKGFSLFFLMQQAAVIFFFLFIALYALFDASGMPVLTRYMMLQHVLLPILAVYYAGKAWRLYVAGRTEGEELKLPGSAHPLR